MKICRARRRAGFLVPPGPRTSNAMQQIFFVFAGQRSHLREGATVEHGGDRVAGFEHDETDTAMLLVGAILAAPVGILAGAGDGSERPIEDANDMANLDFMRRPGQRVAAALALF